MKITVCCEHLLDWYLSNFATTHQTNLFELTPLHLRDITVGIFIQLAIIFIIVLCQEYLIKHRKESYV